MSIQTGPVIELREVSTPKSNQRGQSRTAWSLYLEEQTPSEPASMASSMRWPSHRPTYQWTDPPTSSRATSEPASMTPILNAMAYPLSSPYPPVNLVIRPRATSEPATMASPKSTSSMSKSISEPASMASSKRWPTHLHRSTYQWTDPSIRSCANSEPATMAPSVNAMTHLPTSLYLSVNRSADSFACN